MPKNLISVPAGFTVFCLCIFRSEGRVSEDLVPVPAEGATCPSREYHERNQPPTGTTARDAFRAASGELVSLSVSESICLSVCQSVQLVESW